MDKEIKMEIKDGYNDPSSYSADPSSFRFDVTTREGKKQLKLMTQLGRMRVSDNFSMSDFLYCSDASVAGICNYPSDDLDLVIKSARELCSRLLEPIRDKFGSFSIPLGYCNRYCMESEWSPELRKKNRHKSNPHHWDRGTFPNEVYARVDIMLYGIQDGSLDRYEVARWIMDTLDIDLVMQWGREDKKSYYCLTIGPQPRRVWLEWVSKGEGDNGSNKKTFRGEDYWKNIWPTLSPSEKPLFGPSCTGGKMWRSDKRTDSD